MEERNVFLLHLDFLSSDGCTCLDIAMLSREQPSILLSWKTTGQRYYTFLCQAWLTVSSFLFLFPYTFLFKGSYQQCQRSIRGVPWCDTEMIKSRLSQTKCSSSLNTYRPRSLSSSAHLKPNATSHKSRRRRHSVYLYKSLMHSLYPDYLLPITHKCKQNINHRPLGSSYLNSGF